MTVTGHPASSSHREGQPRVSPLTLAGFWPHNGAQRCRLLRIAEQNFSRSTDAWPGSRCARNSLRIRWSPPTRRVLAQMVARGLDLVPARPDPLRLDLLNISLEIFSPLIVNDAPVGSHPGTARRTQTSRFTGCLPRVEPWSYDPSPRVYRLRASHGVEAARSVS
jgi:hypothetical protein